MRRLWCLVGGAVLLVGCGGGHEGAGLPPTPGVTGPESPGGTSATATTTAVSPLEGTAWRLAEIQSMDDAIGTVIPDDPDLYTMELDAEGRVSLRLNCNRATGTWSAEAAGDEESGSFEFGPLAVTRALCPPPSLDERIAADAALIRSYLLRDGRLSLSLMADGGIWVWEPSGGAEAALIERIDVEAGASSVTVTGSITGRETIDYTLGAQAGQTMRVEMQTSHPSSYFNVLPPGSQAAVFIGSTSGGEWTGTLPLDGDYVIRVYLMASAARRHETATYTVTVGVTGRPDALVTGTPYHATGLVPCSIGPDPPRSTLCSFGVIRGAPGEAEVHLASPGDDVTLHTDDLRVLRFTGPTVSSADPAETVTAEHQRDEWSIGVDEFYFYVIPDAVISGG